MTDEQIIDFCRGRGNPYPTKGDADAMRRLMVMFDCEDAETPQEAYERIMASMNSIREELLVVNDNEEAREVIRRRLRRV